ncbi:MAG: hypothetical protein H6550_13020 [Chitinophagales bacterium]|nr:hypothetical protein [Chitinophagales bacterium]
MPDPSLNIWSVLILLAALQGLVLSIIMWARDAKPASNHWLALFIFLVSAFFAEYALSVSDIHIIDPRNGFITYPLLFFIGPFFWLYTKRQFSQTDTFSDKDLVHFIIPTCMLLAITIIRQMSPIVSKDVKYLSVAILIAHVYIYIFYSGRKVIETRALLREVMSNTAFDNKLLEMKKFASIFTAWTIVGLVVIIILTTIKTHFIVVDCVMALVTSFIITSFGYTVVMRHADFKEVHELDLIPKVTNNTNKTIVLSNDEVVKIQKRLELYFNDYAPYRQHDLMLDDVARKLDVSEMHLSIVINSQYGQNFFDFVNTWRNSGKPPIA